MKKEGNTYALDHSAIIHLAARRENHTNLFRIEMTLREKIDPVVLQKALAHMTRRFPSVIAGIREEFRDYRIVPAKEIPQVKEETACLAVMGEEELRNCAFRVLYLDRRIAVEFFHSMTDGHGGMVVAASLTAEYLRLKYGTEIPESEFIVGRNGMREEETEDDYIRFAGEKGAVSRYPASFQLPEGTKAGNGVQHTCYDYPVSEVLRAAHAYGVSITTLLSGVMMQSVMEIQKRDPDRKKRELPVQIMIPADLRRLFPSSTLRNFSLFSVCGIEPQDEEIPLEQFFSMAETQLHAQNTADFMKKTIAGQRKATEFPLYQALPLAVKIRLLKLVQEVWGESNSCITISNLGIVSFPKEMEEQIERVSFTLSPRRKSPYNCSVVSYQGKISVMFSRRCEENELEQLFSKKLETIIQKHSADKTLTKGAYSNSINKNKPQKMQEE